MAFMATYRAIWFGFETDASLELLISGNVSPANPWGVYNDWPEGGQGMHFLDDPVLEKSLMGSVSVGRDLGDWRIRTELRMGYVWNELSLTAIPAPFTGPGNTIPMFVPSDINRFIARFAVSIAYTLHYPGERDK
jgi:hypothetical protein